MDQQPGGRARIPGVALALAILSPVIGMLYVARPVRAVLYFFAGFAAISGAVLLAQNGWWPAGLSWIAVVLAVRAAAAADAVRIATRHAVGFAGPWFTTWYGLVGIAAILFAGSLSIRAFLFEPFRQPSGSMMPTLVEGDQFFVSKRAFAGTPPQRGDVIVFLAQGLGVNYVKRVIGLPGDVVEYDAAGRELKINGTRMPLEMLGPYDADPYYQVGRENLDGVEHSVLHFASPSAGGRFDVPDGHYFVMGDNRDNSQDSRFATVGYVPAENIIGKVVLIWWNSDIPTRAGMVP